MTEPTTEPRAYILGASADKGDIIVVSPITGMAVPMPPETYRMLYGKLPVPATEPAAAPPPRVLTLVPPAAPAPLAPTLPLPEPVKEDLARPVNRSFEGRKRLSMKASIRLVFGALMSGPKTASLIVQETGVSYTMACKVLAEAEGLLVRSEIPKGHNKRKVWSLTDHQLDAACRAFEAIMTKAGAEPEVCGASEVA